MTGQGASAASFVPWPQPLAVGLVLGVASSAALPGRLSLGLGTALFALALGRQLTARRPWPTVLDLRRPALLLSFSLPVLLGAGVGLARAGLHDLRPDPVAGLHGRVLGWVGVSDGAVLHASSPVRARLSLVAPKGGWPGSVPPTGLMRAEGVVQAAAGKRNPGGFDHAAHLTRRGVSAQLFVDGYELVPHVPLRHRLKRGVEAGLAPEAGALMSAMTLGLRDDLGEVRDLFGAAGMAHLLALSGLHVGVLLLALERLLRGAPRWRTPLLALSALGFVALVGAAPSIVRAATMALAALASRSFGAGRVQPWTALSLAALVGLLHAPQMLHDLSFQLSYLAVAGMLLLLPPWLARLGVTGREVGSTSSALAEPELAVLGSVLWRRGRHAVRQGVLSGLAVSTAAQLPSLSLVLGAFGSLPLLSPIVNVVAVPLASLLVPLGFLAGMLGLVALPLAQGVNLLTGPLVRTLIGLSEFGASLPSITWGEVSWLGHACWAAFVVALAAWAWRPGRLACTACVALVAGGVTWAVPAAQAPPDVWYLDVGQGDAVLIRLGGGEGVLIDGGGSPFSDFDVGARVVMPALRALGVSRLAAVVATHPDADHVEGLLPVLERWRVGLLVTGPPDPEAPLDGRLRQLAERRGIPVHQARRGERLSLPSWEVVLEVLNPPASATGPANERSVALVLRHRGAARALFLGDLGLPTEPDLAVPPVDVLMVPHHGSRSSTGDGLVRAASPRWAVISVGRNQYGHPTPEVVTRLQEAGVPVLTTLANGALRFDLGRPGAPLTGVAGRGEPPVKEPADP